MRPFHLLGAVEQLTAHLREEILRGELSGTMPGVHQLAKQLGTSQKTVVEAIRRLRNEGVLVNQGAGRSNVIEIPKKIRPQGLQVEILLYEKSDLATAFVVEMKYRLMEAGHLAHYSSKTLLELGMDAKRVKQHAAKIKTDAWLVLAGSRPVLEWFATQPLPVMALFGRMQDVPMLAGVATKKTPTHERIVQRLVELGHRRIVLFAREERRLPQPGAFEMRFLQLLEEQGIKTGPYNLPDWKETADGVCECLDSLFAHTPPTALIIDEASIFMTARMHLAQRGIITPKDVSMICLDVDPNFEWSTPAVSHINWDTEAMLRRTVKWVDNIARGREDHRKTLLKTSFVEGGTIGPAPR